MSAEKYSFTTPDGQTVTTNDDEAAAHMRYDLGFDEKTTRAAKSDEGDKK